MQNEKLKMPPIDIRLLNEALAERRARCEQERQQVLQQVLD